MCTLKQWAIHDSTYFINSHHKEYTQGLGYYPAAVNLNRCTGSFNTLNDLPNRMYVPNKTEDLNQNVFLWLQE